MKNKKFLLGMLVMVLAFGMTVVGCGDETPTDEQKVNNTINTATITGTASVGTTLDTNVRNMDGNNATGVSYKWQRADEQFSTFVDISNAASSSYTLTVDDSNKYIRVEVINSDTSAPVLSNVVGPVDSNKTAAPTASPAAGLVVAGQAITLTSTTSEYTSIYYTLDGSTPTTSSTSYSSSAKPIITANNTTLKAIARSGYMVASDVFSATYTVSNLTLTKQTAPSSFNSILAAAYGNSRFVIAGDAGKIAYSSNGTSWTAATDNSTDSFIIYGIAVNSSGTFVAVGRNSGGGIIFTSSNGTSWTQVTTSTFDSSWIRDVAFGGNRFVAVGENGKIAYSTDNGTTWTQAATTQFDTSTIYGVTYGNGRFVAVGASGKMAYSTNGETWTTVANSSFSTTTINGIAYGGSTGNEMFIAVGGVLFSTAIAYSTDGITWTSGVSASSGYSYLSGSGLNRVAWGGNKFIAVGYRGVMMFSVDGINWAVIEGGTGTGKSQFDTGSTSSITDIVYSGTIFLAVGQVPGSGLLSASSPEMALSD